MEADIDAEMLFSVGSEVEVSSDEEGYKGAWFHATILKLPRKKTEGKALIQYKDLLEEDGVTPLTERIELSFIRPSPPQPEAPEDQCFQVNDVVDAFHLDGWWTGFVSKISDNPKMYSVSFPYPAEEIEFPSDKLRPHWKWVNGKWVKPSEIKDVLVPSDPESQELMELSCSTNNDAEASIRLESLESECSSKKHEHCSISLMMNETDPLAAYPRRKRCANVNRGAPDATLLHPSKRLKNGSLSDSLVSQETKMKGLPSETPNKEVPTAANSTGKNLVGEQPVKTKVVCVRDEVQEINLPKEHGSGKYQTEDGAKTGINKRVQTRPVLEMEQPQLILQISESPSTGQNHASGVVEDILSKEYTATEVGSSEIEQAVVVPATDYQTKEIVIIGKPGGISNGNIEQSPLICCKELRSSLRKIPSVVEENNLGHSPCGSANQRNDPKEKSLQIVVQSELQEGENLPFVKSLPIWKAVDNMEIFQVMPQNPHFQPLFEFNEILREGLAVGHMMTFVSVVQKTSMLTVSDPRNLFTSILDALLDLEMLGFDVEAVRSRTSELLSMRDRYGHLRDQSKENEVKVSNHSDEISKIIEEIEVIKKKMAELEEKQALLMSKKESTVAKIATLHVCADVATQDIQRIEYEFENLAGCPW